MFENAEIDVAARRSRLTLVAPCRRASAAASGLGPASFIGAAAG
jgi:hypothetical protein